MSTTQKKLVKNFTALSAVQIANLLLPLISTPIISRIIGPDKYGVITYAATFVSYFNLLIDYGFNLTATRRVARDPGNQELRNRVFSEVLYSKIFLFGISVLLFLVAIHIVEPLSKDRLVAVFSFLACLATVMTQNWMFQAMQELSRVAILNFISKVLYTFSVIFIVREKSDYIWMPLLTNIIAISVAFISFYWAFVRYNLKLISLKLRDILSLLNKEKTIFFSVVVISLYTTTNIVVLGLLRPEEEVGFYGAALALMMLSMGVVNNPLSQAFYPFIGEAFGESREKGLKTVQKFLPMIICFVILVVVGLQLFGPLAIRLIYGEAFLPAIPAFRILAFAPFIIGLSNVFGIQVMLNVGLDKLFFYITFIGACLGVILNLLMTSMMGYIGTAWNWIIVECCITGMTYFALRKKGYDPIDKNLFKYSVQKENIQILLSKIRKRK